MLIKYCLITKISILNHLEPRWQYIFYIIILKRRNTEIGVSVILR